MNLKNLIEVKNLEFYCNDQDDFKIQINDFSLKECLEKGTEMSSKIIQKIGARLS